MRAVLVGLLIGVIAVLPLPARAQDTEPPDVEGLSLLEARQRIDDEWYPGFRKVVLVEPEIPHSASLDQLIVVESRVVHLGGIEFGDPPPTIELTVRLEPPTAVAVTPEPPVSEPSEVPARPTRSILQPLGLVAVLAGAAVVVLLRGRTAPAPRLLQLRARGDPVGQVATRVTPGPPGTTVRLEPRRDPGRQVIHG